MTRRARARRARARRKNSAERMGQAVPVIDQGSVAKRPPRLVAAHVATRGADYGGASRRWRGGHGAEAEEATPLFPFFSFLLESAAAGPLLWKHGLGSGAERGSGMGRGG